jgi:hypothetical protein
MQTDGWTKRQTEISKLIVTFHNFVNTPKNDTPISNIRGRDN